MSYRVRLASEYERDHSRAATLQDKAVAFARRQAVSLLALPPDAPLDAEQRNLLRTLGTSVFELGQILREEGSAECVPRYLEAMHYHQRIGEKQGEAVSEYNLGRAYTEIPTIRDLAAAEAAYRRSLDLRSPNAALGHSRCMKQIGMVHHERFLDARQREEPADTLLRHAQAAETCYLEALQLCPEDALTDLAPLHNSLGALYTEVGQFDNAREHFEQCAQYDEKVGNHFGAGNKRYNMAVMYVRASAGAAQPSQKRSGLLRARAYAEAALRDFRHYLGRAADKEAKVQALLDRIDQALA